MPRTRRRHVLLAAVLALGAIAATDAAISSTDPLPAVVADIDAGDFRGATSQIDAALAKAGIDDRTRADLEFQRERMRRIRLDFTLSADQRARSFATRFPIYARTNSSAGRRPTCSSTW